MPVLGVEATRVESVRRLAHNIKIAEMIDADVVERITTTDVWVQTETKKFDWTSADQKWLSLLYASDLMAAADILSGIPRDLAVKQAGDHRIAARDTIKAINQRDREIQKNTPTAAHFAGPNLTDELDPNNYTQERSETY